MSTLPDLAEEPTDEEAGLVMGAAADEPPGEKAPRPVYMVGPPQRGPSKYTRTGPEYVPEQEALLPEVAAPRIQVMDTKGEVSTLDKGGRPVIGAPQGQGCMQRDFAGFGNSSQAEAEHSQENHA